MDATSFSILLYFIFKTQILTKGKNGINLFSKKTKKRETIKCKRTNRK